MLKYFILFISICVCFVLCMDIVQPGPKYKPTKGEVWPKPQFQHKENSYFIFDLPQFQIIINKETCDILEKAVQRYSAIVKNSNNYHLRGRRIQHRRSRHNDKNYRGTMNYLIVELNKPCEEYPYLGMIESYNLTVSANSTLSSESVWGILRGLETFAHLVYLSDDRQGTYINVTEIYDFPRYAHRGLLIDTSRHYIPVSDIIITIEAMAINKMNVLHWHIVDDQSFPYESEKFPDLSMQGAYDESMIYTRENIQRLVEFARYRGIRIIPEFDVPGHTRSWGNAYPNILTECYENDEFIGLGPMNPIKNFTYKLLKDLFKEVQTLFPDKYFHIGGDEVILDCWESNPTLIEYMKNHNVSVTELHGLFMEKVIPLLAKDTRPIVWQEVYDEGVPLSNDTLIHVWKNQWIKEMVEILTKGHQLIFSSSWYLDNLMLKWTDLYLADPRQMVQDAMHNDTLLLNIVGGEACMWGEMVDTRNIISRVWPRSSAVAERLWSPALGAEYARVPAEAYHRLEEHACRLARRGVRAAPPSGPGYCL